MLKAGPVKSMTRALPNLWKLKSIDGLSLYKSSRFLFSKSTKQQDVKQNLDPEYDVIVIGGGPVGLSAAHNCAKANKKVLVVEQFNYFNQSGSSNDLVRMFRTMYTEDYMANLANKSIKIWDDLEKETGEQLVLKTGLLNFGDPNYEMGPEGNLMGPKANLDRLGMEYRILDNKQIMQEYPFKNLPDTYKGIFAKDNGCINVPLLLRTLYKRAEHYGAQLISNTEVKNLDVKESGVSVSLVDQDGSSKTVKAHKAIITPGAYINNIIKPLGLTVDFDIWEMVYGYYSSKPGPNGTHFKSIWFQFVEDTPKTKPVESNLYYGFPSVSWAPPDLVRIAVDNATNIVKNPKDRKIIPSDFDLQTTSNYVKNHLVGVDTLPNYTGSCLHGQMKDNLSILDHLPPNIKGHKNVAIFTAGWGMKFIPLFGLILKQMVVDGETPYDISHFKITRKGALVE